MTTIPVRGNPTRGLTTATFAFFAGLTTIVLYGVAGPSFKDSLGLTGGHLGLMLAAPHLNKSLLRIPFGAWVDQVGGRLPFLILLGLSSLGLIGVATTLLLTLPDGLDSSYYNLFVLFGVLGGAGGATFSVGVPQTSYWFPRHEQGWALGVYAGVGNIGPGVFNLLIPVLIASVGLAAAYSAWAAFMLVALLVYAATAVDPYVFQLLRRGHPLEGARDEARALGQEVFPSGSALGSLAAAARLPRTWALVLLYTVSFGGGFTALTAWFPTYWNEFHHFGMIGAGAMAAVFTVYGSLIRVPGGSMSDRLGGEVVAVASFLVMALGSILLTVASGPALAFLGMMVLGTGMGVANAAIFKLVPAYVPSAVGGASGLIGGIGGLGTIAILPVLGAFTDHYGHIGYARGYSVFIVLSLLCAIGAALLSIRRPPAQEPVTPDAGEAGGTPPASAASAARSTS